MTAIVVLFVAGLLLLGLEIVLPGAVLGIAGGLAMLAGVVVAFANYGAAGGAFALVVALSALGATVYAELVWLPDSWLARRFSMSATGAGTSQPPLAKPDEVVGREAIAQTVLGPTGFVKIGDRRYEAYCRSGHAAAGERLRVVGLDNFRLIVSKT